MTAKTVVRKLLEDEDFEGLEPENLDSLSDQFERGLKYTLRQANDVYKRLTDSGVLEVLRGERNYDQDSISSAVLRLTLEREVGSLGADRAYKRIKRLARYIL